STLEVTNAVSQVNSGNTELSTRTQEQAAALEEIASSMEEMTATVSRNAENADRANQLAAEARSQAEQGGGVVRQAVHAMEEIDTASKRIEEIIRVIDDIAFQINLLALNAAVEAARAGEQGRGFAVVASEVRNLAGRSATAAKEIKELILDSVSKVESGRSLVNESGNSLDVILDSVKQVSDTVAEIAAASREQSEGINQVNRSITHMDDMTQRNASLVEEVAATAESMGYQSQHLDDLVRFFKLEESEEGNVTAVDSEFEALAFRDFSSQENIPRLSRVS
ncbi:MAG: chemotaxis protein, partial [Pseudomonadales bacterium]|nr:chemotaxis protein [Pseudomonadales bacterium]